MPLKDACSSHGCAPRWCGCFHRYGATDALRKILTAVAAANARALGVQPASLVAVELSASQRLRMRADATGGDARAEGTAEDAGKGEGAQGAGEVVAGAPLDLLTGVHVCDGRWRVLVLEGLAGEADQSNGARALPELVAVALAAAAAAAERRSHAARAVEGERCSSPARSAQRLPPRRASLATPSVAPPPPARDPLGRDSGGGVRVLWDARVSFAQRCYAELGAPAAAPHTIRLARPLGHLVASAGVALRTQLPAEAAEAATRLVEVGLRCVLRPTCALTACARSCSAASCCAAPKRLRCSQPPRSFVRWSARVAPSWTTPTWPVSPRPRLPRAPTALQCLLPPRPPRAGVARWRGRPPRRRW